MPSSVDTLAPVTQARGYARRALTPDGCSLRPPAVEGRKEIPMFRPSWSLFVGIVLALSLPLVGCGDELSSEPKLNDGDGGGGGGGAAGEGGEGGEDGEGGSGGGGGAGGVLYDFDCFEPVGDVGSPVFTSCEEPDSEGPIECGRVDVPLDWCTEGGERITFFFRRFPHRAEEPRGQFWYLPGGPGHSGANLGHRINDLRDLGFNVFVPDYRGVGQSTSLNCDRVEPEMALSMACLYELEQRWGDSLKFFSTTGAAFDIGKVIDSLRSPEEPVFVMGASYGSFVANRYLHLFPDQPTGVVMDGTCHGASCEIRIDRSRDRVARDVLEYCGTNEFCSSKLSTDPVAWAWDLIGDVRAGHCNVFGAETEARLADVFTNSIMSRSSLAVGLSFAYRLRRCDEADRAALRFNVFGLPEDDVLATHKEKSGYLHSHIFLNEFWPDGFSLEKAQAEVNQLLFRGGRTIAFAQNRTIWPWPFFKTPNELRSWAKTELPILMFNGTLDMQTPLAALDDVPDAFPHPNQHFVIAPWGPHSSVWGIDDSKPITETCMGGILTSFLLDPTAGIDRSCIADFPEPSLDWSEKYARIVYGTADLWENLPDDEGEEGGKPPAED